MYLKMGIYTYRYVDKNKDADCSTLSLHIKSVPYQPFKLINVCGFVII